MVEYCEKLAELVIWLDVSESTSQDFNGRKLLPWSPKVENAEMVGNYYLEVPRLKTQK
jgi:hypothetical protein